VTLRARHATVDRSRRKRRLRAGALVLSLVTAAGVVLTVAEPAQACDPARTTLEVIAAPDIAPAIAAVVRDRDDLRAPESCPQVRVRAEADSDVLTLLTDGATPRPDVWIPSSSLWVEHARTDALASPTWQTSIASSPLVLAVARPLADHLRADGSAPGSADVAAAGLQGDVVLSISDPATSPATVGLIVGLQATLADQPDGRIVLAALVRGARTGLAGSAESNPLSVLDAASSAAVPVPEQAVWAHQEAGGPPVVGIYLNNATTPFDYPYTVLTAEGAATATAHRLQTALTDAAGQDHIRRTGFRGLDGVGHRVTEASGIDGSQPSTVAAPDIVAVEQVRQSIAAVKRDARLLAVLDVSGSMAGPAPGPEGITRLDLAAQAAAAGLQLYPDSTEVGLWSFSEDVTPAGDHSELVPIAPLTAPAVGGRTALGEALAGLQPVPDGGTALYETTLAAVRAVRAAWDPARVNAVVLLSDGEDTDDGIGLDELLTTLRQEQADGRAVPVITIAYGTDAGAIPLAAISEATYGASYRTTDPSRIRDVFLDALGQRACRPQCPPSPGR
jgi:Ca-activated chloride channel family protein